MFYIMTKTSEMLVDCVIVQSLDQTIKWKEDGWKLIGFMSCQPEKIVECTRLVLKDYYKMNFK